MAPKKTPGDETRRAEAAEKKRIGAKAYRKVEAAEMKRPAPKKRTGR